MYYVYVLKSLNFDKHYIGQTQNLEKRLEHHNSSNARWTKRFQPWELIYFEEYTNRGDAMKRELVLKKSGKLKRLIMQIRKISLVQKKAKC